MIIMFTTIINFAIPPFPLSSSSFPPSSSPSPLPHIANGALLSGTSLDYLTINFGLILSTSPFNGVVGVVTVQDDDSWINRGQLKSKVVAMFVHCPFPLPQSHLPFLCPCMRWRTMLTCSIWRKDRSPLEITL